VKLGRRCIAEFTHGALELRERRLGAPLPKRREAARDGVVALALRRQQQEEQQEK
jgi:hypothetical protein